MVSRIMIYLIILIDQALQIALAHAGLLLTNCVSYHVSGRWISSQFFTRIYFTVTDRHNC